MNALMAFLLAAYGINVSISVPENRVQYCHVTDSPEGDSCPANGFQLSWGINCFSPTMSITNKTSYEEAAEPNGISDGFVYIWNIAPDIDAVTDTGFYLEQPDKFYVDEGLAI